MELFICALGLVLIIEGLPWFAFPDKMKLWLLTLLEIGEKEMRITGFILMLLGLGLVYLGKQ